MAFLTGPEIAKQIELNRIIINPFNPKQLNPNSYNLRLGNKLIVYKKNIDNQYSPIKSQLSIKMGALDMKLEEEILEFNIPENEGYCLKPGIIYLGHTFEYTKTDHYAPMIEGRSGAGRLGLSIHSTAGFGDIGFRGDWTLELTVIHPLIIYPYIEICQIAFQTVEGEVKLYQGSYLDQRGPKQSRLYKSFPITKETLCPKCKSSNIQRDKETSDHPGVFVCLDCGEGILV